MNNQINCRGFDNGNIINPFSSFCNNLGNICLYPVHIISSNSQSIHIEVGTLRNEQIPITVFTNSTVNLNRGFIGTIVSIVLLLPAVIIGGALKAIAYVCSSELRMNHHLAIKYFNPSMTNIIVVGTEEEKLSEELLKVAINRIADKLFLSADKYCPFYRSYQNNGLILNCQPGMVIRDDPGFNIRENTVVKKSISKLILVGARLATNIEASSNKADFDTSVHTGLVKENSKIGVVSTPWQTQESEDEELGDKKLKKINHLCLLRSHNVPSISDALNDRLGIDDDRNIIKKVYVVN